MSRAFLRFRPAKRVTMQTSFEFSQCPAGSCTRESLAEPRAFPSEVATLPPDRLRSPADMMLANRMFGANCGPGALAASLSLEALNVMQFFPHFPGRPFTSVTHMRDALERCRLQTVEGRELPDYGVALLQFDGAWSRATTKPFWLARYRHWIAVRGQSVYDVNFHHWVDRAQWERSVIEAFRAVWPSVSGWRVERGFEILPQPFHVREVVRGLFSSHHPATQ